MRIREMERNVQCAQIEHLGEPDLGTCREYRLASYEINMVVIERGAGEDGAVWM